MSADFDKFLKLEKRLFKLIDDPLSEGPTTSRKIMGKKERIRNKMRKLEPKIKGMEDGGNVKKMTPKLQKKMEEIMKELGMMSPRIKPIKKKGGGLMEAIEKVKAKEMKDGGNVPKPKMRPKKDPFRADKTVILNEEFSKKVAKTNEEAMKKAKKMQKGGKVSDTDKATVNRTMKDIRNVFGKKIMDVDLNNEEVLKRAKQALEDAKRQVKNMEAGGSVPKKFKGFSKLPEAVQEKMDPDLAKKFEKGGPVKMGSGGGVCRGMGAARAGGKFKLR